ncbi:MAG: hypothetical protein JXP34_16680 [Planctomycetes bacterium]|nr:hypothetical protein [Planctomycetota bacterium]
MRPHRIGVPCHLSFGVLSFAVFSFAARAADPIVLSHDDGVQDDRRSMAGVGQAVRFERPAETFAVTAARVFGSLYGRRFDPTLEVAQVWICDEGLSPVATTHVPLERFPIGTPTWVEVPFPAPVPVPATFYVLVDFYATATRGVYLGIDAQAAGNSITGTPGKPGGAFGSGGWMLRAAGTNDPDPPLALDAASAKVLAYDDDKADGKRSMAGDGHAVLFAAPSGEWYLSKIAIHGSLYGANYDPARTFFHVFVCDPRMRVAARSSHPYSLFPGGDPTWVDVEVPPIRVAGKFFVLVVFNPTATKGVYVSLDASKGGTSMTAMPERPGKALKDEGWMIRATLAKRAKGMPAAPKKVASGPTGADAMAVAEARARFDALEEKEDAAGMRKVVADLSRKDPDAAKDLASVIATDHVLVRYENVPDEYAKAVAALYEACDAALRTRFGFAEGLSPMPGKRLHVHLLAGEGKELALWTSPGSARFPLVVNTMPTWERGFSPPGKGGPHIVYGLCHELGHVLAGWENDRHQWAHYLGSLLLDEVVAALGEKTWPQPYDYKAEGTARFLAQIADAEPDRATDMGVARILDETGKTFGLAIWGKAVAWVKANRQGKPFHATRLYTFDDLRDALIALRCDAAKVKDLFGP